jgi:hypothetical protein
MLLNKVLDAGKTKNGGTEGVNSLEKRFLQYLPFY